jgi:antitoxin MazE
MQQVHISKWGNSLGFRIPRGIAENMGIQAGDTLSLTPADDGILIRKVEKRGKRYALADILDSFGRAEEHPEVDFGGLKGDEVW